MLSSYAGAHFIDLFSLKLDTRVIKMKMPDPDYEFLAKIKNCK